ncbi:unnamed protein product [Durusdinium trenchii]|uniref:MMS19 nucleotide excision repair protein n=1 Tax=Durusdinium trenchii TaxID=1381693 RepID=A0ABP0Q492_9DINO
MAGEPMAGASAEQTVSVEAALKLAEGAGNEEKVLGATLVLRHHSQLLLAPSGPAARAARERLRAALCPWGEAGPSASFLCRLLQSSLPLQRLALGLLTVLLTGEDSELQEARKCLAATSPFLLRVWGPCQSVAENAAEVPKSFAKLWRFSRGFWTCPAGRIFAPSWCRTVIKSCLCCSHRNNCRSVSPGRMLPQQPWR